MNDQERQERIKSLLAERARYQARGLHRSVDAVNARLRELGAEGEPPWSRGLHRIVKPQATRG